MTEQAAPGIVREENFHKSRIQAISCRRFTADMLHRAEVVFLVENVCEDGDFTISVDAPYLDASMDTTVTEAMSRLYPRLEYIAMSLKHEFTRRSEALSKEGDSEE